MRARSAFFFAIAASAMLVACSGVTRFNAPLSESQSVTTSVTTSGGSLSFGAIGSDGTASISSATVSLPALTAAGSVTGVLSATVPSGEPVPSSVHRLAIGVTNTPVVYFTLSFAQNETLNDSPEFSLTLPSAPSGNYYLAVYAGSAGGWLLLSAPGTISGDTITFASTVVTPPFAMSANTAYTFAVVSTASTTASASETYSGTKSITWTYSLAIGCSCTAPPATAPPPAAISYTVASTVSVGSSPDPVASVSALDVHTSESDTASLETTTLNTDSWIGSGAAGSSTNSVLLYAQTQSEPSSATQPVITTAYASPQVLDEIPETNQASWTNSPQSTVSYSYATGDSGTRTVAANGTYTDSESILEGGAGGTATTTENSDGSGSIVWPTPIPGLASPSPYPDYAGAYVLSVTMAAPASNNIVIDFNYTPYAQTCCSYPASSPYDEPLWYSISPLSFYSETDTVKTGATLPSGCSSNGYGSTVNEITRTIDQLDTVVGFEETTVFNSYTAGGFVVCLVSNDLVSYAYDWQNNQPYTVYYGSLGLETQTTSETLNLQAGASATLETSRRSETASASQPNPVALALESHELTAFARTRTQYLRSILEHTNHSSVKPVVVTNQGGRR